MQSLASLVLDGIGIIRQALHVAAETLIVLFQLLRLGLQITQVVSLVLVGRETVFTKDYVVAHHDGEQRGCTCGQATAIAIKGISSVPDMGREATKLRRSGYSVPVSQSMQTGRTMHGDASGSTPPF